MLLSYHETTFVLVEFSGPYIIYSLTLAGVNIANEQVLRATKDTEGLGSLFLIFTVIRFTMSFSKGMIDANSILISRLKAEEKNEQVGRMARTTFIVAAGLSALVVGLDIAAGPFFALCGADEDLADGMSEFFRIFSIAIPAIMCLTCAQQITLGLGDSVASAIIGVAFSLLGTPVSYPLLLNAGWGLTGLALGDVAASYITAVGALCYLKFHPKFNQYNIFKWDFKDQGENIITFLKVGFPLGLQHLSEYINPLVIGLWISAKKEFALAALPSAQLNSLITYPTRALSITTAARVAEEVGHANDVSNTIIANKQAKRFGSASILLGTSAALFFSMVYFTLPDNINHAFISFPDDEDSIGYNTNTSHHYIDQDETYELATAIDWSNGIGIIFDMARITAMGALSGREYIWIPTIVSIALISGGGLGVGAGLVQGAGMSVNAYYLTRDVAYLFSAGIVGCLWLKKSNEGIEEAKEQQAVSQINQEGDVNYDTIEIGKGSSATQLRRFSMHADRERAPEQSVTVEETKPTLSEDGDEVIEIKSQSNSSSWLSCTIL